MRRKLVTTEHLNKSKNELRQVITKETPGLIVLVLTLDSFTPGEVFDHPALRELPVIAARDKEDRKRESYELTNQLIG